MSTASQLPAQIEAQLEAWADALLAGELGLHQLPPALAAFFHLGAGEARQHAEARVRELEHECDRLYLAAANPADRAAELQRRLDEHFAHENDRFFHATHDAALAA